VDAFYQVTIYSRRTNVKAPVSNSWMSGLHCACGSGLVREELFDARGVFLSYVCKECLEEVLKEFPAEVLTNPDYLEEEVPTKGLSVENGAR
jgi:hypothetical protein